MVLSTSQVIISQDTSWVKFLPYQFPSLLLAGGAESSCRLFAKVIPDTILVKAELLFLPWWWMLIQEMSLLYFLDFLHFSSVNLLLEVTLFLSLSLSLFLQLANQCTAVITALFFFFFWSLVRAATWQAVPEVQRESETERKGRWAGGCQVSLLQLEWCLFPPLPFKESLLGAGRDREGWIFLAWWEPQVQVPLTRLSFHCYSSQMRLGVSLRRCKLMPWGGKWSPKIEA